MEQDAITDKGKTITESKTFPVAITEVVKTENKVYGISGVKIKSKEVWIRNKPVFTKAPFQSQEAGDNNKIGSSYSRLGQDVLRGLSSEEELKYLPEIIGTRPTSEHWEKEAREYWANISKKVPPSDEKGQGGLRLEVGRKYTSQADEDFDTICTDESLKKGYPLSVSDYILYRYCLVYNRVANSVADIHNSPKIDFYIYSKEEEITTKKSGMVITRTANLLFYQKMADREWVDWVLRIFIAGDNTSTILIKNLDKISDEEKDIELEKYVKAQPIQFVAIGNDSSLELRAFIELCVAENKLLRLANTDTILMGDLTLGSTVGEAVAFLKNPKNAKVYDTLKAQVKLTP